MSDGSILLNSDNVYSTGHDPESQVDNFRQILNETGVSIPKWLTIRQVKQHIYELDKIFIFIAAQQAEATFFLLFNNRDFLFEFQSFVSDYIKPLEYSKYRNILRRDGVINRPSHLPEWLKTAIFHRDKGRCQICFKDITMLHVPIKEYQFDHMIPLATSGSNDPTNFQLVCEDCNLSKGKKLIVMPQKTIPFWQKT